MIDLNKQIKSVLITPVGRVNKKVELWPPLVDFDEVLDLTYEIVIDLNYESKEYLIEFRVFAKNKDTAIIDLNQKFTFDKKNVMYATVSGLIDMYQKHELKILAFGKDDTEEQIFRSIISWKKQILN